MINQNNEPNKEFFESTPRSALIRNLCIEAIRAARGLIDTDGEDVDAADELIEANRQLAEIGITPNMHTITDSDPEKAERKRTQLKTDPIIASEWLAGQMRNLIIETNAFSNATGLSAKISEHDELVGEIPGVALLKEGQASILRDIGMVGMLSSMIDFDAGPSEPVRLK